MVEVFIYETRQFLEQLEQMVKEINRDVILPEDRLSDHVYRYDPDQGLSFALPEKKQKD